MALGGDRFGGGRLYGGTLIQRAVPFVRAGGSYAGQLTAFDTGGSDLTYLVTVLAPYLLTVCGGFALLRRARASAGLASLAAGLTLMLAPLIGLAGDYYEAASIVSSRVIGLLASPTTANAALGLRHDDVFALAASFGERFSHDTFRWAVAAILSWLLGVVAAGATLRLSQAVARRISGEPAD